MSVLNKDILHNKQCPKLFRSLYLLLLESQDIMVGVGIPDLVQACCAVCCGFFYIYIGIVIVFSLHLCSILEFDMGHSLFSFSHQGV